MTDELLCPFCGQELDYLSEDIYGSRVCPNCKCLGWVLHGNDSMWEELTTIKQKLDDLQKDYDLAIQHSKTMTETCLGYKAKLDIAVDVLEEAREEIGKIKNNDCPCGKPHIWFTIDNALEQIGSKDEK